MDLKHLIPHQRRRGFGPALDLQFVVDKTLTARVGPTPVFTRASGATFVDSDGLVKYAPENLVINSQNFANNSWLTFGNVRKIRTSTIPDPSGGLSAYEINVGTAGSNGLIYHQYSTTFQATGCTYSVWVRSVSGTSDFAIRNYNGSTSLSSGALTATTTWTRFEFTFTDIIYQIQIAAVSANAVGNILVWGAQAERSASARAYIPTFSAALYRPRFDHDPTTLVSKGLLMEDARTNILLQSQAFDSSIWDVLGLRNLIVSANNIASPSGAIDADKLTVGGTTTAYRVVQNTPTYVSGTAYTVSCYLKAAEVSKVQVSSGNTTTFPASANFDLTGSGSVIGTPTGTAVIQQLQNGWYRCSISAIAGANAISSISIYPLNNSGGSTYVGNNIDSFYAWGGQLEVGRHASSYIPTTISAIARSADVCSITGTAFSNFCNQTEGTLISKLTIIDRNSQYGLGGIILSATDRFNCHVAIAKKNNIITASALRSYNNGVAFLSFTTAVDIEDKIIFAFKQDSYAASCSGSALQIDNSGLFQTNIYPLNQMVIGSNISNRMFGWISSIQYYRQQLPNSSLQALSTIVTNTITYNGVQIQFNTNTNGLQTTN